LQPHHLHVPNVMEIWESKPPGTLWATPGLLWVSFTFYLFTGPLVLHVLQFCALFVLLGTVDSGFFYKTFDAYITEASLMNANRMHCHITHFPLLVTHMCLCTLWVGGRVGCVLSRPASYFPNIRDTMRGVLIR